MPAETAKTLGGESGELGHVGRSGPGCCASCHRDLQLTPPVADRRARRGVPRPLRPWIASPQLPVPLDGSGRLGYSPQLTDGQGGGMRSGTMISVLIAVAVLAARGGSPRARMLRNQDGSLPPSSTSSTLRMRPHTPSAASRGVIRNDSGTIRRLVGNRAAGRGVLLDRRGDHPGAGGRLHRRAGRRHGRAPGLSAAGCRDRRASP